MRHYIPVNYISFTPQNDKTTDVITYAIKVTQNFK